MSTITEEQKKLVEENHNLIYSFCRKHSLSVDEYYDIAALGLCRASMYYDEDRGNFSTFAYKCMYTSYLQYLRHNKHSFNNTSLDKVVYRGNDNSEITFQEVLPTSDSYIAPLVVEECCKSTMSVLNARDKEIFSLSLNGYNQQQISSKVGFSQSRVSSRLRFIKCVFKDELAKYIM